MTENTGEQKLSAEEVFQNLFGASASGTGEEELLRIAAKFSVQISGRQMRCLVKIQGHLEQASVKTKTALIAMVAKWFELKQYHNSNIYVMRALDSIALRKFVNENTFKVNVQKN